MEKSRWADITDDDPIEIPVIVTKHGINVSYVPPHVRVPHKSSEPINIKDRKCPPVKSAVKD